MRLARDRGVEDVARRAAKVIDRPIRSLDDLSKREASRVIDALQQSG